MQPNVTLEGTGASRADRLTSYNPSDFTMPHGTEEEWRFTPMERIADFLADDTAATPLPVDVRGATLAAVEKTARADYAPDDRPGAVAWAAASNVQQLTIAGDHEDVFITMNADEGMNVAQLAINAEENARGTIVISHAGRADLNEGIEMYLAEGSELTVVSIQEGERSARHLSSQRIRLAKDAKLRHIVVTLGGDVVRISTSVNFDEPGGEVELLGAYMTDAGEHQEHRLFVNHQQENCTSKVTYKGALQGENAHSVWIGDVLIGAQATNTDTYELNRNLVLTRGPKADSVPNLEIKTGKILGAGHASATGRFDEEQLFYLQARGIPEDVARRLVVRGFFAEMIENIGIDAVRDRLMAAIENELDLATGDESAES